MSQTASNSARLGFSAQPEDEPTVISDREVEQASRELLKTKPFYMLRKQMKQVTFRSLKETKKEVGFWFFLRSTMRTEDRRSCT